MKVLIIKMSSLGDIAHTFPALTDAAKHVPGVTFDWVVEESFSALPAMHPSVDKVIRVAFRRLRKKPFNMFFTKEWKAFKKNLQAKNYDLVIDAQGLLKSAFITFFAHGKKAGLDKDSLWEPLARFAYQKKSPVNPNLHAVIRMRELFSKSLDYTFDSEALDYGVKKSEKTTKGASCLNEACSEGSYVLFLHGTTWATKQWPIAYWKKLAKFFSQNNTRVIIPWGNAQEKENADDIASGCSCATVLPKLGLNDMIQVVLNAKVIVAVDTGLAHIAAAFGVPAVSLYGPTDPKQTGALGANQVQLAASFECAPCLQRSCTYKNQSEEKPACFTALPPRLVYEKVVSLAESIV